jgi:hypothetical protein
MFGIEKDYQKLLEQVYGPLGEKPQMTDKITLELTLDELELIDKHIEYNEETKSVFDKIKYAYPQLKMTLQQEGDYAVVSYNDTTYYRFEDATCFSWYMKIDYSVQSTLVMVIDAETERLLEELYYNHIEVKKEKVSEWEPTPQTPEQVADGLKEAFREAVKQGVIPPVEKKQKTLTNLIERWWCDVFTIHSDWDMETSIDDLVDRIQLWLPKEQFANSQNEYVELTVEGFNDCLNKIKDNLR